VDKQQNITLGSLFDGIGGFPYAASFFGIEAPWASEIMPCAISVTRRHLPRMEHVGDITELHGGELPPVDIITFGSPCQGLSAAGKRRGLADPRSGLFSEAIRIIDEMREATDGKYPTWAVWENVPGALSSNGGFDFKAVLEAFTEAEVPVPQSGKWANAGMVRGGRADLAWCVYNAQHFGTAQRRRRIFLVADFGGKRAGEVLFVPKSLQGYFAAGGTPQQGPAAYAAGGADRPVEILNDQGGAIMSVEKGGNSPTLRCETHGHLPVVAREAYPINTQLATRHRALGMNTGFGVGDAGDPAYTLQEARGHAVAVCDYCAATNCLTPWDTQQSRIFTEDGASPTLAGADGGGGRNPAGLVFAPAQQENGGEPDILCRATAQTNAETLENLSATLTCYHEQPIICGAVAVHQNQSGNITTADTAYTLTMSGTASSRNAPLVAHPKISGTLCASGAGLSRPAGMASETDLCVVQKIPDSEPIPIHDKATRYMGGGNMRKNDGSGNGLGVGKSGDPAPTITAGDRHAVAAYCLQGNMIGRRDENGPRGNGVNEDVSFTLTATDTPAVAAVDCRNLRETEEISGTLQAKENGSYSLNYQNPVRLGYIVRRLTPTECERLQGYPDGWTAYGDDGKPISDTKRYQMLGNSVAVPCVAYILLGIAERHEKEVV